MQQCRGSLFVRSISTSRRLSRNIKASTPTGVSAGSYSVVAPPSTSSAVASHHPIPVHVRRHRHRGPRLDVTELVPNPSIAVPAPECSSIHQHHQRELRRRIRGGGSFRVWGAGEYAPQIVCRTWGRAWTYGTRTNCFLIINGTMILLVNLLTRV